MMSGKIEAAIRWSESRNLAHTSHGAKGLDADLSRRMFHMREIEDMVYARLCLARDARDDAMVVLSSLHDDVVRLHRWGSLMEVLLLQASAYQAQGDLDAALDCLQEALKIGESQDYRRIFLDEGEPITQLLYEAVRRDISQAYVGRLLADYDPDAQVERRDLTTTQDQIVEPLSEREIEVLHWIAEGLTNREIAQKLYLSTSTIKAHTYHIYGKLNVHNRTQAVAKARALGVLAYTN
jgi:LuxR family maltose regulon positive regulatory protein